MEEEKNQARVDKAMERQGKQEEIKGKQAERILAMSAAYQGKTSPQQTVKE